MTRTRTKPRPNQPRAATATVRWPLHPQPSRLEALSSWTQRLAKPYGMSARDLLVHKLGLDGEVQVPMSLDYDPPEAMLAALAERTGVPVTRLRMMTQAGWAPWLFDSHHYVRPGEHQEAFDNYVRANSVLLPPGEAGVHELGYPRPWPGPWHGGIHVHRACPVCAADPACGTALVWQLPLTIGCDEHGCRLHDARDIRVQLDLHELPPPTPVEEPLATLDRYTYAALTTGRVDLPGRSVHAGVWFRLLRSLLDELSLAESTLHMHARNTLEQVWSATGLPYRAGLNTWRPYESLDWQIQQAMLLAAATALHLAAEGEITARGRLASAIQPPRDQYVYDGDQPHPALTAWQEALIQAETKMAATRTNPDAARQMLAWFTLSCLTLTEFETQRAYLFGAGIPASFLPSAAELGRTDLI